MVEIAQNELGLDLDHLARVNVKGKLLFYTDTGDEHTYSLKAAHEYTRPGCLHCPDFAAEHADISFGGLGQSEGWTLTIVRSERGVDIWNRAVADGIVEARPASEDPEGRGADVQARGEVPRALARAGGRDGRPGTRAAARARLSSGRSWSDRQSAAHPADGRVVDSRGTNLRGAARRAESAHVVGEELRVDRRELLPLGGDVVLVEDRRHRARRLARTAVHALVRLDVEHPRTLVDAVDRTLVYARTVLHVDAGLCDRVGHINPFSTVST